VSDALRSRDVCVVIPTRNRRELLGRALRCVLGQEDVELEIIVVDEASGDGTSEWLATLRDERVLVIRHERPLGPAAARNAGIERARSHWIAFLDDDDVWAPQRLSAQLDALAANPGSGWAAAAAIVVDERLRAFARQRPPAPEAALARLLDYNVIPGGASAVLARTDLVRQLGGFDPMLRVFADWDLWIRLADASPLTPVDRPLVGYVLHGANMTNTPDGIPEELRRISEKHAALRAASGIEMDEARWREWFADMERRKGLRLAPASTLIRLAFETGRVRLAVRGLAIAVWPGWVRWRDAQRGRRLPADWREEAEGWLAPLRGGTEMTDRRTGPTMRARTSPGVAPAERRMTQGTSKQTDNR
jgi:glycosyltransferase involved in cell wall biosynthesis